MYPPGYHHSANGLIVIHAQHNYAHFASVESEHFVYLSHRYIYIYIIYAYMYIYRESNHGKKNYILEKYFRLTSLSIHGIYISLKTVT